MPSQPAEATIILSYTTILVILVMCVFIRTFLVNILL